MRPKASRVRLFVKILVSAVIGTVAYVFAAIVFTSAADREWSIFTAVFIAGVAFVTQYLVDVENVLLDGRRAQDQRLDETARRIQDEFVKINAATELFGLVEGAPMPTEAMTEFIRYATAIDASSPPLILDFARREIARVTAVLRPLGQGEDVIYEGEDRDWLLGLTESVRTSVDATSRSTVDASGRGFIDGGLWLTDLGQRYLEAQRDTARRGVQLRRVFIVDDPNLMQDGVFRLVLETHRSIGAEVRVLEPDNPVLARWTSLLDFVIFDQSVCYELTPATAASLATSQPIIVNTRLVSDPRRVRERAQRFDDMWQSATEPR